MSMSPERFKELLRTGGKLENQLIKAGKEIARRYGYYAREKKAIILKSNNDEMQYRPDLVLWRTDSSPNYIIIEFEKETLRKEIEAEIVLSGLVGAKYFVFVSNDMASVDCAERYGKVLTSKIKEIAEMKVKAILAHTKDQFENEFDALIRKLN